MKRVGSFVVASAMCIAAHSQTVIDPLIGDSLSPYTLTPVLYSGTSPDTTTIGFSDGSGNGLEADGANFNNIEQALFLRNDYSLSVGETLSVAVNYALTGIEDIGLVVASTATPPAVSTTYSGSSTSTRNDLSYAFIGLRGSANHVVASGFDGATSIATQQYQPGSGTTTTLFISEMAPNTFTFGAIASTVLTNGGAVNLLNYTFVNNSGVGTAIGFYVDMRANNDMGYFSNLTISPIPEPAAAALCGLGASIGLIAWKRRKI